MSFEHGRASGDRNTESTPTLAVVIRGHRLAAGLVDQSGRVVVRDRVAMPGHGVWQSLERLINRVLAAAPPATPRPWAVGVTCSGPIDTGAGSVSPSFIPAWNNFPLRERLSDLTELPTVLDTTAGAAADVRVQRSATPLTDFIDVVIGSTVESACVVGGHRLRGAHGNAGSIAHIVVEPGGRTCWCGGTGCAEAYVAVTAIEAEIKRPLQRATSATVERTGIMLGRALSSMAATIDVSTAFVSGALMETFGAPMLAATVAEVGIRSRLDNVSEMTIESVSPIPSLVAAASVAHHDEWTVGVTDG